jgi:hypothetical protein
VSCSVARRVDLIYMFVMPLYDHPEVCRTYFYPRPGEPLPAGEHGAPLELRLKDGTRLGGYWSRPLSGAPTILYLHGNGEIIEDDLYQWPSWAEEAGANLLLLDYPGYATSDGRPTFSSCSEAARAARDFLLARPADEVPALVIAGRSIGSIFALDAAASCSSPRLRGLLLESGIADLKQRLALRVDYGAVGIDQRALEAELDRDFDHRRKLAALPDSCAVLVLHCRHDSMISSWHAQRLAEWAGARLLRLVLFEDGDHNTIHFENGTAYRALVAELVRRAGTSLV